MGKVDELLDLIADDENDDIDSRIEAMKELKRIATQDELKQIYTKIEESDDFWVRELLCEVVAELDSVKSLPCLFKAFLKGKYEGHDNDTLTSIILDILELYPQDSEIYLIRTLRDKNPRLRSLAVWGCGFAKTQKCYEEVQKALNDKNEEVRDVARSTLKSLQK